MLSSLGVPDAMPCMLMSSAVCMCLLSCCAVMMCSAAVVFQCHACCVVGVYPIMQAVTLLSSLGVPDTVFEARQASYLAEVACMCDSPEVAFKYLMAHGKVRVAMCAVLAFSSAAPFLKQGEI